MNKSVQYIKKVLSGDLTASKQDVTEACEKFKEVLKDEPNRTYLTRLKSSSNVLLSYELLDDGSIREGVVTDDNMRT